MGSCLFRSISLLLLGFFSKTAPCCSNPGIYSFCGVFKMCSLSTVLEVSTLSRSVPVQLVYLKCLYSVSCILSFRLSATSFHLFSCFVKL